MPWLLKSLLFKMIYTKILLFQKTIWQYYRRLFSTLTYPLQFQGFLTRVYYFIKCADREVLKLLRIPHRRTKPLRGGYEPSAFSG